MKSKTSAVLIMLIMLGGLAVPIRSVAQEQKWPHVEHHRYRFIDPGTFGGPLNYLANDPSGGGAAAGVLNARGTVVSGADTSTPDPNYPNACLVCPFDPLIFHLFRWHRGVLTDLGALPGKTAALPTGSAKTD